MVGTQARVVQRKKRGGATAEAGKPAKRAQQAKSCAGAGRARSKPKPKSSPLSPPVTQNRRPPPWRTVAKTVSALALGLLVASCSRGSSTRESVDFSGPRSRVSTVDPKYGTSPSPRLMADGQRIPKGGGSYKLGAPYRVAGRWYVPQEDPNYDRAGVASWYGADFHGRKTANGEVYDMDALTAAHPTMPLPSYAYVTNISNGRTVLVRVNDRGPYAHDRIIDLSRRTARLLGSEHSGVTQVRVRYAGRAPLDGDDRRERDFVSQQSWYRSTVASNAAVAPWGRPMGAGGAVVD